MNNSLTMYSFENVASLHVYNEFDGVRSFYTDLLGDRKLHFRGFGQLYS